MTVARFADLRVAVYQALDAAFPDVEVMSAPSVSPPARYVRIDGFTVDDDETFRNRERGRHGFMVHIFDAPEGGTQSLRWVAQGMATAAAALRGLAPPRTAIRTRITSAHADFDTEPDQTRVAHAVLRVTITMEE